MSTKYNKVTAMINNKAEVLYLTDSELERCRNRLGKEGCEDVKIGGVTTVKDIVAKRNLPLMQSLRKRKVLILS